MKKFKKRHFEVCYYLLEHSFPVSLFKISKDLGYSINTLKKDLPLIEELLKKRNIRLIKKPHVGIIIEADLKDIELFKKELKEKIKIVQDKNERFVKVILAFILYKEPPTIEKLSEILEVSNVTAYNYVRKVKDYFQKMGISLSGYYRKGYRLIGEEEKIRDLAVEMILSFYHNDLLKLWGSILESRDTLIGEFFKGFDFKKLISLLERWEERYKFKLDDIYFIKLILRFAVSFRRIKFGKIIKRRSILFSSEEIKNEIDSIVNEIRDNLLVDIPTSEYSYLFSFFLEFLKNSNHNTEFNNILNILLSFLDSYYLNENRQLLEMLIDHLLRSIQKLRSGEKIENPLLTLIKETYKDEFNLANQIIKEINKKFLLNLDENEAGYIALYLNILNENTKKKRIAIVCPMGIATSNMLYWKIKKELPNVEIVDVLSYKEFIKKYIFLDVDLIVSTAPLPISIIPYIIVSPLLTKQELEALKKIILGK